MEENSYTISRQDAAKILKLSVRTLDRYLKGKKISSKEVEGRVYLNMDEIRNFSNKKTRKYTNLSTPKVPENVYRQNAEIVYTKTPDLGASKSQNEEKVVYRQKSENVYRQNVEIVHSDTEEVDAPSNMGQKIISEEKNIFYDNPEIEDLKKQLKENIEFQQNKERALMAQISEVRFSKTEYERSLRLEKIKKTFFLILFLAILAFQPVWIYFAFFK
ncbi:MAG: hypothetical protein RBS56_00775 [Candidatus Gracilibacteria bacterium]|jgi:hypothetical protein|nr:hypothetical protein [Candidatus Gracilibacteria bacterium]